MNAALISYSAGEAAPTDCALDRLRMAPTTASSQAAGRPGGQATRAPAGGHGRAGAATAAGAPFRGWVQVAKMPQSERVGQLEQEAAAWLRNCIDPQIGQRCRGR